MEASWAGRGQGFPNSVAWAIEYRVPEDVARSTSEVTRLGGTVEGRESGDWGSLTRCADPFGNGFCLVTT